MEPFVTHAAAFLLGTATGAAGTYYAELFTDQRRKKEKRNEEKRRFMEAAEKMPDLLKEMKEDLVLPEHTMTRDFFVISKGSSLCPSPNSFVYTEGDGNQYLSKVKILESCGYVADITPKGAPMFRMQEHFVTALKGWQKGS